MQNILFDLDGTLTNPETGILNCIEYALNRLGMPIPARESMKKYIGPPLRDSFKELLNTECENRASEAVMVYRERFSDVGKFENQPYKGITETLDKLKQDGHSLYICTSKPTVFARQIAEHFGFASFFSEIHGSNLDGSLVDKTELIRHILKTYNIQPENCSMIGDRSYDINGAVNNNVTPYGVSYGFGKEGELKKARTIFKSPYEIAAYQKW